MPDNASWRRYLRFWGPDPLQDAEDEVAFHLEMKREELRAAGVPPEQLEREVARAFGDSASIHRELRGIGMKRLQRARRANLLDELSVDLKHAWRSFRRRPGVPLVIVTTLALAIGAGTAVFSMFDAVLLNPLAVHQPERLVALYEGDERLAFSYPMLQHLRDNSSTTSGVAGFTTQSVAVRRGEGSSSQLRAGIVTGDYFSVLNLRPQAGRLLIRDDEAAAGTSPYVVLSDALWRRAFGGDDDVVGSTIMVNELPFTVVGVASPRFRGTSLADPQDLWLPITMVTTILRGGLLSAPEVLASWDFNILEAVARPAAGTTVDGMLAELTPLHAAAWSAAPDPRFQMGRVLTAAPLNEAAAARSRDDLLRFLRLLAAAVAVALAIACVNVANLMLMRGTERRRELSIRAAVGAGRTRVVRQLLVESAVLGLLAGALGAGLAFLSLHLLGSFALPGGIDLTEVRLPMDARVLGFTAAVALLCALAFGLAPALAGSRTDVMDTLRGSDAGRVRSRAGSVLLTVQVALSLVLLVAGSLFVRSLQQALNVDLGFRSDGVAVVSVGLRQHAYAPPQLHGFLDAVLAEAAARPGVHAVAAASAAPFDGAAHAPLLLGADRATATRADPVALLHVTPGYLELLQIPVLHGRGLEWTDRAGTPAVALVNEAAAGRLWPDRDAIGQQFIAMFGEPYTVVGIIADAHLTSLTEREPHVVLPMLQRPGTGTDRLRVLAAAGDAGSAITALRSVIHDVDPRLSTFEERSLQQQVERVMMPQRFGSILLSAFGAIALLISAVGIYAVASYDVARRYREIGIRAALGASRGRLIRTVVGRSGLAIGVGVIAGVLIAAYATQALQALLFGITTSDPASYVAAVVALAVVAVMASWVPARRAARVDPLEVLRE